MKYSMNQENPQRKILTNLAEGRLVSVESLVALIGCDLDRNVHVHHLQHLLGLGVHFDSLRLLQSRSFRDIVIPSLSLLFLELDGDSSDSRALQSLHQVSDETSNLISKRFRGYNRNLVHNPLVGVEIQGELGVVLLDDQARSLLDGLRPNTSHFRVSCRSESSNISL